MDINQLRQAVNSLTPDELRDFSAEASFRFGVNKLISKPTREHLLAAAKQLVSERMMLLGIKPRPKREEKREAVVHTINRRERERGRNGPVRIVRRGD